MDSIFSRGKSADAELDPNYERKHSSKSDDRSHSRKLFMKTSPQRDNFLDSLRPKDANRHHSKIAKDRLIQDAKETAINLLKGKLMKNYQKMHDFNTLYDEDDLKYMRPCEQMYFRFRKIQKNKEDPAYKLRIQNQRGNVNMSSHNLPSAEFSPRVNFRSSEHAMSKTKSKSTSYRRTRYSKFGQGSKSLNLK